MRIRTAALAALFAVRFADGQTMSIEDYEPKSTLVVPEHGVMQAKYPFVEVHNHQNIGMSPEDLDRLAASPLRAPPEYRLHRRAPGLDGREPGPAREAPR